MVAALLALVGMVPLQATTPVASAAGEIALLPSANPANFTPNVLDGEVDAIWQVGNRVIIGGTFTQVANATQNGGTVYARSYLAAFNATTGLVDTSFAPVLSGAVTSLVAAADGQSVYIGGDFNTVNGVNRRKVARVNLSNGSLVTAFNANGVNGLVKDIKLVGNQLYVAGAFTAINSQPRTAVASLSATTGALTTKINVTVSGTHNGGRTAVYKMDVTPAGDRLLMVGNFTTVGGLSRRQAAMLDLSADAAAVSPWSTTWYTSTCSSSFESYLRDVDISPDGAFAVISTTGAYRANQSCDTISRFEVYPNTVVTPTWVNYTGGDTTYAVEIAGGVVFVGGHMRWVNNPSAADAAGPGAVPREGILALDPVNGMPFSWNPGRERGVGVFDFFVTEAGLWAGSDTDRWADEMRQRLAFFPFASGTAVPATDIGALPSDVYLLGRTTSTVGPNPTVLYRINAGGPTITSVDDGPNWTSDTSSLSTTYRNSGSSTASYGTVPSVDGTVPNTATDRAPVALFSTERYDPAGGNEMQWNFNVTSGTRIQVRLYMTNRCTCTASPGQRQFDVDIDNVQVLDNIDLAASPGHDIGAMRAFDITSDGTVNIRFRHVIENPTIFGIEIVRADGDPNIGAQDEIQRRFYNGTAEVAPNSVIAPTELWRNVRGAFMVGNVLYTGNVDGTITKRTFDGTTFGPAEALTLFGNTVANDLPNVTGMFLDPAQGRLYYTLTNDNNLYFRYFTAESSLVGATRYTVAGGSAMSPNRVRGMFLSGGFIWFADANSGQLLKVPFAGGVLGGAAVVAQTTLDWRARDMFVWTGAPAAAPNTGPTAAAFTWSCTFTSCTFTDGGSTDLDGVIAGWSWDFGGTGSGSGSSVDYVFPTAGDHTVTLTITDDDGATAQHAAIVHVDAAPNVPPTAAFTVSCSARLCTFDGSASSDTDGGITGYEWAFGDGETATGATTSHTYAADGTFSPTLTVTDTAGATHAVGQEVTVEALSVAFRASNHANSTGASAAISVPAGVQAGDQLVLFVTANVETTLTTPAGWTLLGTQVDGTPDMRSWVFTRTATAGLAGSTVNATFGSTSTKSSRILLAYAGAGVPSVLASSVAGPNVSSHAAPAVEVVGDGSHVVAYWSDKTSGNTGWTLPGGVTDRVSSVGGGSGRITAAAGEAGPVAAGTWPGATATSSVSSAKAIQWSVVIPSGDPTAAFNPVCVGLLCTFDASGSSDGNGSIVSYTWDFGDGATGIGVGTSHTYGAAGTFDVRLTVLDDSGATASVVVPVTVAPAANQAPTVTFTDQCIGLDCTFDASASTDADGTIQSYSWDFGDGTTATGAVAQHTYGAAGSYTVSVTALDDDGASTTASREVQLSAALVGFRASSAATGTGVAGSVVVPAGVQPGDQLVLFVTANANVDITAPVGWTFLGTEVDGSPDMRSSVFTTTAGAGAAGSTVTAAIGSTTAKSTRLLVAYSGAGVPTVATSAVAGPSTATHQSPTVEVASAGSFVVSYWSDKSGGNPGWTVDSTVQLRQIALGTGSGQITAVAGDAGPLLAGTWPGATATSSVASAKAIHWSVVIPTA